jgi:hypothetical protein
MYDSLESGFETELPGLGGSLWRGGFESQVSAIKRAHKADFAYAITLSDRARATEIAVLPELGRSLSLPPEQFRELSVKIRYSFFVAEAAESYSVGCVFDPAKLRTFFQNESFLLREVVAIPELAGLEDPLNVDFEQGLAVASDVFRSEASIDGESLELDPHADLFSRDGIRWKYMLTDVQRERLEGKDGALVEISITTFQPTSQRFFPFAITVPTRNVHVVFDYEDATSIDSVDVETFFTGRRPFEAVPEPKSRQLTVRPLGDWALVGNGCVFTW